HQRRENIRGAFEVTRPEEIAGKEVLLVDDVFTTGTTVSECAKVLRRAGAERVLVATVARVMKGETASISGADRVEAVEVSQA
ncbi:MAG: ComF family protein, partial [Terriglobales bacterium]